MPSRLVASAALAAIVRTADAGAQCPGSVDVRGYGEVALVPTGWGAPDGGAAVEVVARGIVPQMGARAYLADACTAGRYNHTQYLAPNLLGRRIRYTMDLSGAGCGCNAAFYLTSMRQNARPSTCGDFYCDANDVCGESCAEIDIQEANMHAWHSTLHSRSDRYGVGGGCGGGGPGWSGPRDWTTAQYGPGGDCIDTSREFNVTAAFPVHASGELAAMTVMLSQASCSLTTTTDHYKAMGELSDALRAGMTPILSYWSANDMLWLDGKGQDEQGACSADSKANCADSVRFSGFSIEEASEEAAESVAPAAPAPRAPEPAPAPAQAPPQAPPQAPSSTCAGPGEECSASQRCCETGQRCYRRSPWWAACGFACDAAEELCEELLPAQAPGLQQDALVVRYAAGGAVGDAGATARRSAARGARARAAGVAALGAMAAVGALATAVARRRRPRVPAPSAEADSLLEVPVEDAVP